MRGVGFMVCSVHTVYGRDRSGVRGAEEVSVAARTGVFSRRVKARAGRASERRFDEDERCRSRAAEIWPRTAPIPRAGLSLQKSTTNH
ncbi:hypothetical protein GCM10010326_60730 [Streptomyces xanthochromogenes]|uniref:Uncharacterized protein n=2 Tax=Streptomyces xanthochromogenes TaxID=67384 RepID=A0ABQ3AIN6_9ACTN|nr:hypothetical protein GCM10010326_60730 [Streptomyces xanthochromogenes]